MPSFSNFADSAAVSNRFQDAAIVYVEGRDDVEILRKVFPWREGDVLFRMPIDGSDSGGCTAVRQRVARERPQNKKVFGLVDRDYLARCQQWALFYEADDAAFRRECGSDDGFFILSRWELENYLVEAKPVRQLLENWGGCKGLTTADAVERLLALCVFLLPISGALGVLHERGDPDGLPDKFGVDKAHACELEAAVAAYMRPKTGDGTPTRMTFAEHLEKVKAFDPGPDEDAMERVRSLLRIVDGKRLVRWIQHHFRIRQDPRFQLADNLAQTEVDSDLHRFIDGTVSM